MKALVLEEYGRFAYKDVPDPAIGRGDVLIRVRACGICGSDVHGMDGRTGRRRPPLIMGHEAAGVVAEVGADVRDWRRGDRVTFDSTLYCGDCFYCRRGEINLCDRRRVAGVSCDDYKQDGAFAEYIAVPERVLYRLPDKATFEQAAMVEVLSIALHAVARTRISINDTALVCGAGPIGLLIVQALRLAGCGRIIAADIDAARLALAVKLGADLGLRSDASDVRGEVNRLTAGRGVDIALEAVGITPTVRLALDCLRKGGALTLVGNVSPTVDLPLQWVVTRQVTINGSCASCGEYPACLELIARGAVNVDALISAVTPLSEGASWFKRLYDRDPALLKVVLVP